LANKLLEKYGNLITKLSLVPADGGIFDITKNNILIFSKKKERRFPDFNEIVTLLD
tara:strand:- start:3566 stop:3733 length:168 start_codon:yes stop_codon:yes gene_type:complete